MGQLAPGTIRNCGCERVCKAEAGIKDAPPVASFSITYGDPNGIIHTAGEGGLAVGFGGKIVAGQGKGYGSRGVLRGKPVFRSADELRAVLRDPAL